MQTKNTTMLAAGLVVAIIALAGVGYAAVAGTQYTATTTNVDNKLDATYLTLTQSGSSDIIYDGGKFLTDIYFNSETTKGNSGVATTYTPVTKYMKDQDEDGNDTFVEYASTYEGTKYALASETLNLKLVPNNNRATTVGLDVTVTGYQANTLEYWMLIQTKDTNQALLMAKAAKYNDGWHFTGLTIDDDGTTDFFVTIFVTGVFTPGGETPTWQKMTDADFTFKVTATEPSTDNNGN